jgi:glycosyltransferase involved in cell wall biosynthesis
VISVCLATYNGSAFVAEQLRSVLTQLGANDEVVVSDDASSDDTLSIISGLADARIRVLQVSGKLGVVKNFERALMAARGDIIFLCDQDDVWLPCKVERCLAALAGCQLVVTDCIVVDGDLNPQSPSFFQMRKSGAGLLKNLWKNSYLGCCMAMRSDLLKVALPFPSNIAMHDWWIGLVAEMTGSVVFIDEQLSLYRRHGGNATPTGMRSTAPIIQQLIWRVEMVRNLLVHCFNFKR